MSDYQFDTQDKVVQQMSKDGLIQENLATGKQESISTKKADYDYSPVKAAEIAINVAADIHEYEKYYSSSGAEAEQETEEPVDESVYRSSYNQGAYTNREEDEVGKQYYHDKNNNIFADEFKREVKAHDYKFNRKNRNSLPTSSNDEQPLHNPPSGGGPPPINPPGGGPPPTAAPSGGKYNPWDKKIKKAEIEVHKRQKKIPKQIRLKFERTLALDEKENIVVHRRLKFKKEYLMERNYNKKRKDKYDKKRATSEIIKSSGWNIWAAVRRENRDDIHELEANASKDGIIYGRKILRKSRRNIQAYENPYARLGRAKEKLSFYRLKRDEYEYDNLPKDQKKLQKQLQKKRYKNAAIHKSIEKGQTQILRHRNMFVRIKDAILRVIRAIKHVFTIITSGLSIFIIVMCLVFGILLLIIIAIGFGGESAIQSTYKAGYEQISDCTAYMQKLETDLKERISKIETEECPGCYEYIYNLAPIGHNSIELISYLAAKYIEFDLDKCLDELNSLFGEMYTLIIEIKEEPREREKRDEYGNIQYDENGNAIMETFMAEICYITLEAKPLSEIAGNRLDTEQKKYFDIYMLSSGGQQVYANCLPDRDWSGSVSSKFGERIHPITGERTFHNGVDIAVPIGTAIYSSASGIVTTSAYSESAGNYIIVTMENGWSIKYMHMDSRNVSAGTAVLKGQLLGASGNTGRSTGPHLHLEVRDTNDKPIDPTFMIPSNSVIIE